MRFTDTLRKFSRPTAPQVVFLATMLWSSILVAQIVSEQVSVETMSEPVSYTHLRAHET